MVRQITFQRPQADVQAERQSQELFKTAVTDLDPINTKILGQVVNLGNTVLMKKAAGELHR